MQDNEGGVIIPPSVVVDSEAKKKRGRKTLAQIPVYRAAANAKFIVAALMNKDNSPRKLTKFFDQMLGTASELKKSIGMAEVSRNAQDRTWYLECARVLTYDLSDDFTTLRKLGVLVDKDLDNKVKAVIKSINAQLVAWRDYTSGEGAKS